MDDHIKLANLIFPNIDKTSQDYENMYPARNLTEGAKVVRIAPSPTGYLHIGTLFAGLCDRRVADQSNGIFYLRLEDTDKKREVEDAAEDIIEGFKSFGIFLDEGVISRSEEKGDYGPYTQSKRIDIYHCYVKELICRGQAYPCFCSEEELEKVRSVQEAQKVRTGYYGQFTKCRNLSIDDTITKIQEGKPFVIRLKSPGNPDIKVSFEDGIKGKIEMPENDQDLVLLKSNMVPTYHFAHAVDDHLMRTTHVIRGDEWLSSVPIHLQLFKMLGHKVPKYAHIAPIMKEDAETGGKRKLSKRKDPETAVKFYAEQGYPGESVVEYLLTIANSDFEDWRKANPGQDNRNFKFNLKKMSLSGALFDINKLNDVSKNVISMFNAEKVYELASLWAEQYDKDFYRLLTQDKAYSCKIFSIDRGTPKPRKDMAKWSDIKNYCSYFFDGLYTPVNEFAMAKSEVMSIIGSYMPLYDPDDGHDTWFEKIKSICAPLGFSPDIKAYKKDPDAFKGHVGDVSSVIRMAVTGRANTPDLCGIMHVLGKDKVLVRLKEHLK